jgi:Tfp pilus assembly ATPase PilU
LKSEKEIPRSKLVQVHHEEANELLESLKDVMFEEDEYFFIKEYLNLRAILSQKLLIKDHKEINNNRNY